MSPKRPNTSPPQSGSKKTKNSATQPDDNEPGSSQGNSQEIRAKNPKIFMDAVHGSITLPPLCVKIIDTPQFQRLRYLKQLGPGYFVYPSACHNRFEHSLGVCHLAGLLVQALKSSQPELDITNEDVLCVQLAGLCHDLGHGPFSHLWQVFMKKAQPEMKWKHEEASTKMLDHLIDKNNLLPEFEEYGLDKDHREFIKDLIWRPDGDEKKREDKSFLYDIVANEKSGVDVDKWDYLLRDSHNLGIKVTFDYQRLVQHARVIEVNGKKTICFRDKQIDSLYDMFHARQSLHRIAYKHRVVQTIDSMLIDAFMAANEHTYGKYGECKLSEIYNAEDLTAYCKLNDNIFHEILHDDSPDLRDAQSILENILKRKLYHFVGEAVPIDDDGKTADDLEKAIKNKLEGMNLSDEEEAIRRELEDKFVIKAVSLDYGKGNEDPIESVSFYGKKNLNEALPTEDINIMLPRNVQQLSFRVWIKSDTREGEAFELAKKLAEEALKKACQKLGWKLKLGNTRCRWTGMIARYSEEVAVLMKSYKSEGMIVLASDVFFLF